MVWGAVYIGGRSDLVLFDTTESTGKRGGVTAPIYRTQITDKSLRDHVTAMNMVHDHVWVLEDNAPVHTALGTRSRGLELGFNFINHPSSSPDLNPIENVWAMLKYRLRTLPKRPTTKEALFIKCQEIWKSIDQKKIDNCILSMPRRLELARKARGGPIPY